MASLSAVPAVAGARRPLPLLLQVLYGAGEIPITATMGLFGIYVLFFYNSVMGLDGALAGIGVTAGLIVDAVLDPYVGFRSDASRLRWGRRQSFMLFGCLGMGPFFWALLSPPRGMATPALFCWLLFSSLGFRFCFATYRIPYLSLGAELTADYDERTRVIAVRSLLGLLGMAAAATLPLLVFFRKTANGSDAKLQYAGYPRMGLAFGALMIVAGLVAVIGTQSRRTWSPTPGSPEAAGKFFRGMWIFFQNPNFRTLWVAFLVSSMAVVVNFSLWLHYLKWYAGLEDRKMESAVQGAFYVGAVAGVATWIFLAKRGEKRNFLVGSVLGLVAILVSATLFVGKGHLFGTANLPPLLIGTAVAGIFASAFWVLPFSMMADVVDEDELLCGLRREGTCFGIMNFGEKLASGGGLLISGVLLSRFIHLAPRQEIQTPGVAARIGISYGIVPGVLLLFAAAMAFRFRLDRQRVREIQAKLQAS